ncbi:hypothetical protein, partial [Corallococcus sp. 4LFB]|uniref:hypothetical protein n=1 Tax=Corallococcus sp. 4LFB TaxID=3383249 RepID=UPI0039758950
NGPRGPGPRGPGPAPASAGGALRPQGPPALQNPLPDAGATGAVSRIDLEALTDKVHQRLLRQLTQERERRGLTR